MATSTITLKTDTTANWESSNRILALNEPALERTTDGYINMKLGDGVTPWNKLGYVFKLKTLEELNASASTSSSSASEQVTLAKAELVKCVSEYEKTKEISDGLVDKTNFYQPMLRTLRQGLIMPPLLRKLSLLRKLVLTIARLVLGTTYSSNKIESMLKVLNTNQVQKNGEYVFHFK